MDGQASLKTQSGGRRTENREQMTEDRGQSEKLKAEGRPAVTHSLLCARGPGRITVFRWTGASVVLTLFINQTKSPPHRITVRPIHRPPPSPNFQSSPYLNSPSPVFRPPPSDFSFSAFQLFSICPSRFQLFSFCLDSFSFLAVPPPGRRDALPYFGAHISAFSFSVFQLFRVCPSRFQLLPV